MKTLITVTLILSVVVCGDVAAAVEDAAALELDALVHAVLDRNPSLEAMRHAWLAAEKRYPQDKALDDPTFSYAVAPETFGKDDIDPGQTFTIRQRLPWPGKRRLRGEAATYHAEMAKADLETARQQLVMETRWAFYDYYYIYRAIELNHRQQDLVAESVRVATTKYAAGTLTKQTVLDADVQLHHIKHKAIQLQRIEQNVRGRINTYLNRSPELGLPPPPEQIPSVAEHVPGIEVEGALAHNRPELESLDAAIEAEQADAANARRDRYPDITLMASYDTMWAREEHQKMVGVALDIPLNQRRRSHGVAQAELNVQRLQAQRAALGNDLSREAKEAYEELLESKRIVELYRVHLIPTAVERLASVRSGYASGNQDFLELTSEEVAILTLEREAEEALASFHQHVAHLERALGAPLESLTPETAKGTSYDHQAHEME